MTSKTAFTNVRKKVVTYLREDLLGPRNGEDEFLEEPAYKRYTTGIIFPRSNEFSVQDLAPEQENDISGAADPNDDNSGDDPISLSNQLLQSSFGISFFLRKSPNIRVQVKGAVYEEAQGISNGTELKGWQRQSLDTGEMSLNPRAYSKPLSVFGNRAKLHLKWRNVRDDGWIVTVTVINASAYDNYIKPEQCLHQVRIDCYPEGGTISAYPRSRLLTDDTEEHILDILYRNEAAYGVGHGCSVEWTPPEDRTTNHIWSEFIPEYSVPAMRYDLDNEFISKYLGDKAHNLNEVLNFHYLAESMSNKKEVIQKLHLFVDAYEMWIDNELQEENQDISSDLQEESNILLDRLKNAVSRMRRGINVINTNRTVLECFALANRAMLLQRIHSSDSYAGSRRQLSAKSFVEPNVQNHISQHNWRPFQLAFQLLTISSVAFEEDPDRDVVDLIWFPTGGGKTEAYLAVTAFIIFYRRIMYGDKGFGTSIIMRYTLRLLTAQQFQRASTLLCACELIRRSEPEYYGNEEISIGLWVGRTTTPNTFQAASDQFDELRTDTNPISPYQIDRCPWCGTEIIPAVHEEDVSKYGVEANKYHFFLYCPDSQCPFHNRLPVKVVDDQIYEAPPTLLLATVDKFARMTWEPKVGALFGEGNRRPPELIIQDELHLISGPLGTMVGLYETAINALIELNGVKPKIIASTATIRQAGDQVRGLYARNVQLFPPSGLRASDSYFARYDYSKPGRLYTGIIGQGHTSSTTQIRVSAALLQAPEDLNLKGDELDAYYTLVAYHNSLRELGKTLTFAADDIPARLRVIARDQSHLRDLSGNKVAELTSNVKAEDLGNILSRLNQTSSEGDVISFLACTNMLSVGVDVPRLGLMIVSGQPKSTSEYIQSTSRVGRGNVPGLVVCIYSPSKPRDRSHYERFVSYHSSLYREVEPTSVTPFSSPARIRALHAILVAVMRNYYDLPHEKDAAKFSKERYASELDTLKNYILDRVKLIDPEEAFLTEKQLSQLIDQWEEEASKNLHYYNEHKAKSSLLARWGDSSNGLWNTLDSMRNIDQSILVKVRGKKVTEND